MYDKYIFFLRKESGEIEGSDKLMLGYLAKKFKFSYSAMQPKGAFSGLLNMASAQFRPSWDLMIVLVIEMCNSTAGEQ